MKTRKVPRTRRTVILFTAFLSSMNAPGVPNTAGFCLCIRCGIIQMRVWSFPPPLYCRFSLRRYVANRYHPQPNQMVTCGVGNSCAPVAEPLTPGVPGDKLLAGGTACATRSCRHAWLWVGHALARFSLPGERNSPVRRPAPPLVSRCKGTKQAHPGHGAGRRVRSKQTCRPIGVPPSSSGRTRW